MTGESSSTGGPSGSDRSRVRVAFAIPRRVGKAVVRNRIRRRLRAILTEADPDRAPSGAYLVAVRPGADGLSYRELSEHVHRALVEIAKRNARRSSPRADRRGPNARAGLRGPNAGAGLNRSGPS